MKPILMTLHEAAEQLHVHPVTVRRAIEGGDLTVVKLGKTARGWRIDPADLEAFIQTHKHQEEKPCRSEKPKTAAFSLKCMSVREELDALLRRSRKRKAKNSGSVIALRPLSTD